MKRNRSFPNSLVILSVTFVVLGLIFMEPFRQGEPDGESWAMSLINGHGFYEDDKLDMRLEGTWLFAIGDDPARADQDYDDSYWEKVKVPASWESQGFEGYNGYAWYRNTVQIPDYLRGKTLTLVLGAIDDVDEVYVNGVLIGGTGQFPPNYRTAFDAKREYNIPGRFSRNTDELTIAIRVFDSEKDGGMIHGPVGFRINGSAVMDIPMDGMWRFSRGDRALNAHSQGNINWETVKVPGNWEDGGYQDYDGFAWYQHSFEVPVELTDDNLVLYLGKIDDLDKTWINGVKIGQTGDAKAWAGKISGNEWQQIRAYKIPRGLLKPGMNEVTVQVFDALGNGGIHEGPVGIIREEGLSSLIRRNGGDWTPTEYDPDRYKEY